MWKRFLINMAIDMAFDEIIKALQKIAQKSSSNVDNKMVKVIKDSKPDIINQVKASL